jgi:hypothetical protein
MISYLFKKIGYVAQLFYGVVTRRFLLFYLLLGILHKGYGTK